MRSCTPDPLHTWHKAGASPLPFHGAHFKHTHWTEVGGRELVPIVDNFAADLALKQGELWRGNVSMKRNGCRAIIQILGARFYGGVG